MLNFFNTPLSSCLFATIVVHAYYRQVESYHHIFLMLIVSGILLRNNNNIVNIQKTVGYLVVKILSYISFIMIVMETPKVVAIDAQWMLWFPFATLCVFFTHLFLPGMSNSLSLLRQQIAVLGTHMYLWMLY